MNKEKNGNIKEDIKNLAYMSHTNVHILAKNKKQNKLKKQTNAF